MGRTINLIALESTITMSMITPEIFARIIEATDSDAKLASFIEVFDWPALDARTEYLSMVSAHMRDGEMSALRDKAASYSIPKTIAAWVRTASDMGCSIAFAVDGEDVKMTIVDGTARTTDKRTNTKRTYYVDGAPLFDNYKSIAHAMRTKGGFDKILSAVGPGNAHKADSGRWSIKTSLNAWQALQALGTDTQRARFTRS